MAAGARRALGIPSDRRVRALLGARQNFDPSARPQPAQTVTGSFGNYEITAKKEREFMSTKMLRVMGRTICLTVFCLSLTLLAVAAGRTNITGTWELNHLQGDKPDQNAQGGADSHADLTDFTADQVAEQHDQPGDQRETVTAMPNDRILLMMAAIYSPPNKL